MSKGSKGGKGGKGSVDPRQWSRLVVDGAKQTPSRAMLRAVGFTDADFAGATLARATFDPQALQGARGWED